MPEKHSKQSTTKWLLVAAGWAVFAIFFASEGVVSRAYAAKPLQLGQALTAWLLCAASWFLLTPLVLLLARRFPLERGAWRVRLLVHLAGGAVVATAHIAIYISVLFVSATVLKINHPPFAAAFRNQFIYSFHADFLTYWALIGLNQAVDYYRRYRERELRAALLETSLAHAQLDALKMQLHPHFLFNTLNSISVLMAEDVTAARRMLTSLSDLLRASLENVGSHEISLKEELEFLKHYLEIEQTRFQDRLTVRLQIEPQTLDASVPNLILQPLVENAIRHGIAPHAGPGVIEIHATRLNGMVELRVADNGPGLGKAAPERLLKGIGLSNTEARLQQLYGEAHRFCLDDQPGVGLTVTITIPFRSTAAERANGR